MKHLPVKLSVWLLNLVMIRGFSAVTQTVLGTLFTWGLTGAGAALVFCFSTKQNKVLDGSLGFAAGVMIAASYWSLLKPAIEIATDSQEYGTNGEYVFLPVGFGFLLGALFVFLTDLYLPCTGNKMPKTPVIPNIEPELKKNGISVVTEKRDLSPYHYGYSIQSNYSIEGLYRRQRNGPSYHQSDSDDEESVLRSTLALRWRRILLLIIAITVHNIPEGLAVGVGFGAVNKTKSASFESARNLAFGIGMQNFPEGLAVSLPLHGAGMSRWKSFWYGQLSGLVEPLAGVLGCFAVTLAEPILPYALSFAAGAMIYVVVDDIIPEAQMNGNSKLASWLTIVGFIVMMTLDVGLG